MQASVGIARSQEQHALLHRRVRSLGRIAERLHVSVLVLLRFGRVDEHRVGRDGKMRAAAPVLPAELHVDLMRERPGKGAAEEAAEVEGGGVRE